jgi:hypothetical protein
MRGKLGVDEYPSLVTLTPDPMLSGKLKYHVANKEGGAAFRIGRASGMDLELDGVGICQEHCEIIRLPTAKDTSGEDSVDDKGGAKAGEGLDDVSAEFGGAEFGLRVFKDAKVHVNGKQLKPETTRRGGQASRWRKAALYNLTQDSHDPLEDARSLTPLHHGDRIILGPCRFVAVFLAFDPDAIPAPEDDDEDNAVGGGGGALELRRARQLAGAPAVGPGGQQQWEYSAVVAEMMHHVGRVPRLFGSVTDSPAEGRLWEELLRGLELVNQANEIAAEMSVNVEFCATLTTTLPPDFDETQVAEKGWKKHDTFYSCAINPTCAGIRLFSSPAYLLRSPSRCMNCRLSGPTSSFTAARFSRRETVPPAHRRHLRNEPAQVTTFQQQLVEWRLWSDLLGRLRESRAEILTSTSFR